MDTQPLISIALCTYNGRRNLKPQLDSLLTQTYTQIEIVACDDASSDDTFEILTQYAQRDARLRCRRNPHNLGFSGNFEQAIRLCRGELIALCDQDDIWLPQKLEVLLEALNRREAVMVYCNSGLIDADGRAFGRRLDGSVARRDIDHPAPFVFDNPCSGHATLYRRAVVERALPFPEGTFHDWWLAFAAASLGPVAYVDECLVQHRRHQDSVTFCIDHAPADRRPGFRARELEVTEQRVAQFAAFASPWQDFFRQLLALWRARKNDILSLRLAAFMVRHRQRLFAFSSDGGALRLRLALKFVWGLSMKRWLEPHRYHIEDTTRD